MSPQGSTACNTPPQHSLQRNTQSAETRPPCAYSSGSVPCCCENATLQLCDCFLSVQPMPLCHHCIACNAISRNTRNQQKHTRLVHTRRGPFMFRFSNRKRARERERETEKEREREREREREDRDSVCVRGKVIETEKRETEQETEQEREREREIATRERKENRGIERKEREREREREAEGKQWCHSPLFAKVERKSRAWANETSLVVFRHIST